VTSAAGSAADLPPFERSVFLNCPFDKQYEPLFDALIFTTLCCGLVPRSAIESDSVSTSRMDRLRSSLLTSKYSIHDLCRCQGEGELNLARFNMPLELGIAVGLRLRDPHSHEWCALTLEDQESSRYISDLLAYDLMRHNETVESLVPPVLLWLQSLSETVGDLEPPQVVEAYAKFKVAVDAKRVVWSGMLSWRRTLDLARQHVPVAS
jgi:hypothetical protein